MAQMMLSAKTLHVTHCKACLWIFSGTIYFRYVGMDSVKPLSCMQPCFGQGLSTPQKLDMWYLSSTCMVGNQGFREREKEREVEKEQ
jgi:hypothetical protein